MNELRTFQTKIMTAKRELKEVYYTTRNADSKADAKELVVALITLQRTVEDLITLRQKNKNTGNAFVIIKNSILIEISILKGTKYLINKFKYDFFFIYPPTILVS